MKFKLYFTIFKLFLFMVFSISTMSILSGCSLEQFWGLEQISRPGSNTLAADTVIANESKEAMTPEQARRQLENGIRKALDSSTYNIKVSGKIDWKLQDQSLKVLEYGNTIILDRNEKCFQQEWFARDMGGKDKPAKGIVAGKGDKLYIGNGSGKWEQGNPQLFSVVLSNLDSVIKHLNSIPLYGSRTGAITANNNPSSGKLEKVIPQGNYFNIENTYIEKNLTVIEGSLGMDAENAAASRGLFSAADVRLSSLKVGSFNGKIKIYMKPKDGLIVKEEITGSYNIDGQDCPVNIKVEIDKINETIVLKLPTNVLDTAK